MHYAIPAKQKYPIETIEQVKQAELYFGKYLSMFHPAERAAAASCIEKRASDLGVALHSQWIPSYISKASALYSPEFKVHMEMRKEACRGRKITVSGKDFAADEILEKIASKRESVSPQEMVNLLSEFDKTAKIEGQYDRRIRDPFFTVFGRSEMNKRACDEQTIMAAANNEKVAASMKSHFGDEFTKSFKDNPLEIYDSMPAPEKEVINGIISTEI
jgi:hypothetical protein